MSTAAVIMRKQNMYIDTFNRLGATSAEKAISLEEANIRRDYIFSRMISRGIFLQCENGKFYVDNQVVDSLALLRRKVAFIAVLFIVAILIMYFIFGDTY